MTQTPPPVPPAAPPASAPPPRKGLGGPVIVIVAIVVGAIVVFVVAIGLLVAILVPTLSRARELAKQAVCGANLNAVGKGIALYQAENDDASPPDFKRLITDGLLDKKALVCPSVATGRDCDYFYLPVPFTADASMSAFMACDLKGNHGDDGRNVLYVNLSVGFVPEADFQAELALPCNAAFAAGLKQAEGP